MTRIWEQNKKIMMYKKRNAALQVEVTRMKDMSTHWMQSYIHELCHVVRLKEKLKEYSPESPDSTVIQ